MVPMMQKGGENIRSAKPISQKAPENVHEKTTEYDMKERVDFTQTVMFKEFKKISGGQLKGSFNLSELITKFRFQVDGVSSTGLYGLNIAYFSTSKDFYLSADIPFALTAGDKINIPITLNNNLKTPLTVRLTPSTSAETEFLKASIEKQEITIPAFSSEKVLLYVDALV